MDDSLIADYDNYAEFPTENSMNLLVGLLVLMFSACIDSYHDSGN